MSFVSVLTQSSNGRPPSGVMRITSNHAPSASARSLYAMRAAARSGYQNASRSRYAALTATSRAASLVSGCDFPAASCDHGALPSKPAAPLTGPMV